MFNLGARRKIPQKIPALPIDRGPYRTRGKPSRAVRAHVAEDFLNASFTERAFKRADHGLIRVRRQFLVAILTGGPKFKHILF